MVNSYVTKIILIGDARTGKSSLRRSYLGKSFDTNYLSTIGADFSIFKYEIDSDTHTQNNLWDLAGQDSFKTTHPKYFIGSHAAIIVYDVTNQSSFDNIELWINRFMELSKVGVTVTIVGNKTDLNEIISEKEQNDMVNRLREQHPLFNVLSIRTSAKTGHNIVSCVQKTIGSIVNHYEIIDQSDPVGSDLDAVIPFAYISTFDNLLGPKIIKKSPNSEVSDKEFINSMKITSLIDNDSLEGHGHIEGSTPWMSPNGSLFYYIAFNNLLKGGDEMIYIIGFVCEQKYNSFLENQYDLISGYLHNTMNNFNRELLSRKSYLKIMDSEIMDVSLLNLRTSIFDLIQNNN